LNTYQTTFPKVQETIFTFLIFKNKAAQKEYKRTYRNKHIAEIKSHIIPFDSGELIQEGTDLHLHAGSNENNPNSPKRSPSKLPEISG